VGVSAGTERGDDEHDTEDQEVHRSMLTIRPSCGNARELTDEQRAGITFID
jgi:hypothetical protein